MTAESYVKQIVKKVKCSRKKKTEIRRQLLSDIQTALQQGETLQSVILHMGEPIAIAEEFNLNLTDKERRRHKKETAGKIIGCIAAAVLLLVLAAVWFLPRGYAIEDSSTFDAAELEEKSREVIRLLDAEDYESLRKLSDDKMASVLSKEVIDPAKEQTGPDWGEFKKFGKCYMAEQKQMGRSRAVVQINAAYENIAVTYTLLFDKNLKLAGLYMK